MFTKSTIDIIKEAALAEEFQTSDIESDELRGNFNECVGNIPVIARETVAYNARMVPVFQLESAYFVEMDTLAKYMNSFEITDVAEAMENIAEANEIDVDDMALVIESEEYMNSIIESAITQSKNGDKSLLESCELAVKLINMLESEGITVCLLGENKVGDFISDKKDALKKKMEAKKKQKEKEKKQKEKEKNK